MTARYFSSKDRGRSSTAPTEIRANAGGSLDLTDLTLITEEEIRSVGVGATVRISGSALVTPLAADLARERHVNLQRMPVSPTDRAKRRRIAIGADHGGFEMKEALKKVLADLNCDYQDFGTNSAEPVDYPDFAQPVALAVARKTCELGIMIDGAGIGSCMVANKIPGVRAAMCYDEASARNSREHNGANVLTLGGKMISNAQMRAIVRVWLSTDLTEERHRRRVAKIDALL
jgi:ribose 5-phosphate isomerase B